MKFLCQGFKSQSMNMTDTWTDEAECINTAAWLWASYTSQKCLWLCPWAVIMADSEEVWDTKHYCDY